MPGLEILSLVKDSVIATALIVTVVLFLQQLREQRRECMRERAAALEAFRDSLREITGAMGERIAELIEEVRQR